MASASFELSRRVWFGLEIVRILESICFCFEMVLHGRRCWLGKCYRSTSHRRYAARARVILEHSKQNRVRANTRPISYIILTYTFPILFVYAAAALLGCRPVLLASPFGAVIVL